MDANNLKQIINSLSKTIEDSEKIALPTLSNKLAKASDEYPEDYTIGMVSNIVDRMAGGKKLFITRAELKDLYNKLYSRNTKFAELFSDELGEIKKVASPTIYNREGDDETASIISKSYDRIIDPVFSNALDLAFSNTKQAFSKVIAEDAKEIVERQFKSSKLASKVSVVNGNEEYIICNASFETPKGTTSVLIPIEVVAGKALLPSVFISNAGPEDFSRNNVESYVVKFAGVKSNTDSNMVLKALAGRKEKDISNVDIALIKLNASKETAGNFDGILFQKVANADMNLQVKTPEIKDEQIESFAKTFDTSVGRATFTFGKDVVNIGRSVIANKLNNFGVKNYQISVMANDENSITYAVSLNGGNSSFKVPVKVSNKNVINPNVIIVNGSINSFSKDNIFVNDKYAAAVASPLYGTKASELVQYVREMSENGKYASAEEALNVLASSGDDKAYKTAFASFSNALSGVKKVENKCKFIVKNSSSTQEICGHTGLSLGKVHQDVNGDCIPNYRQGMEDTNEGAYFMNSKIFF